MQAQEPSAAALSIRARTTGVDATAVERALVEERSIVRMTAMRGTLHLVPTENAAWLNDLFAPATLVASHRRLGQLGVPAADRPRAVEAIRDALAAHGPLTRTQLMEHVARTGIETAGQAAAHLAALAALEGHVCLGPSRGSKPTYVLRDDWLGANLPRLPRERALAELAHRYVRAYGPATPRDFATWSGLTLRDARAGWEAIGRGLVEIDVRGEPAWMTAQASKPPPDPAIVRLLPAFDTYLLGYRTRALAVPPEHARRVWPGGGIVRPTIAVNGLVVGTWKRAAGVTLEPFPGADIHAGALADEVAAVEGFAG